MLIAHEFSNLLSEICQIVILTHRYENSVEIRVHSVIS
jgi:hypothetical protein